jgi:hypothetical protein
MRIKFSEINFNVNNLYVKTMHLDKIQIHIQIQIQIQIHYRGPFGVEYINKLY